jgi:nucleoside-diphosphate-sugar epimerase
MTRVLITGAAGLIGRRLTKALGEAASLTAKDGQRSPITELCLADAHDTVAPRMPGIKVEVRRGNLSHRAFTQALAEEGFDSLFHLASYLTLQAERDPAAAFAVNVEALRRLIEGARGCPKLVFTSSLAIFGGELPEAVEDDLAPAPETTYGSHKAINELLIADYSRLGRIDGRSLRLPIVLTRPGPPQPVISDRLSGILREPLHGVDVSAPLAPATAVPVASVGAVVAALIRLHDLPAGALPPRRAMNLPALTVTLAEMAQAATRRGATGRITYAPDAQMQAIVESWPKRFVSERATRLGITADADLDALISDYLDNRDG